MEDENNIDVNQLFSFELFQGFENITHLTLSLNWRQYLNESVLKEIDINLPNLQCLRIENEFFSTPEGVQQMADILSRLSNLETLTLKFAFHFVTNDNNSDIRQLFSLMKAFPALKRLHLRLFLVSTNIDVNQLFSFELFKAFENITHFSLQFYWTQTLKRVDTQRH